VLFAPTPSSTVTASEIAAINTTSATVPIPPAGGYAVYTGNPITGAGVPSLMVGCSMINLASPGTAFLLAQATFTVSADKAYGFIGAWGMR
jgi:hypothetical protein